MPLALMCIHNALDGAGTEVIAASFHHQTINKDLIGAVTKNGFRNKIFAGGIGIHNCADQIIGHLRVIGQQQLGVFGQAINAITK